MQNGGVLFNHPSVQTVVFHHFPIHILNCLPDAKQIYLFLKHFIPFFLIVWYDFAK